MNRFFTGLVGPKHKKTDVSLIFHDGQTAPSFFLQSIQPNIINE